MSWLTAFMGVFRPLFPFLFYIVFPAVVAVLILLLVFELIQRPKRHNLLFIKIIGDGVNHTATMKLPNPHGTYEHDKTEYKIDPKRLFRAERGFRGWIGDKIRGVKHRYWVFFREGESDPIALYVSDRPKTPAETLYIIRRSTALNQALASLFGSPLGGKKILFIVIVVAVVAFGLYQLGFLNIPVT